MIIPKKNNYDKILFIKSEQIHPDIFDFTHIKKQ